GATLALQNSVTVAGSNLTLQDGATLASLSGFNSWNGPTSVDGTSAFEVDADQLTVNGIIDGTGQLAKTGAGELVLPAANTFSGGADVREGTVTALAAGSLGAAGKTVTVEDGATVALAPPPSRTGTGFITVGQNFVLKGQGVNNEGALWNELG